MEVRDALGDWKAAAKAGSPPADARLIKGYTAEHIKAGEDGGDRSVTFTITTGAVDRDNDTISPDGWDVEAYLKNPVVLWAHMSRQPPIGRAVSLTRVASALKATAEFMTAELSPLADTVFRMIRGGWLKATSVGFIPTEWSYDEQRGGFNFLKATLLEFSVCPIPSNPEALMDAKHAGIDLAPVKVWAERTLDELSDEPGLWLPKSVVERALRVAEPKVSVAPFQITLPESVTTTTTKAPFAVQLLEEPRYQITQAEIRSAMAAAAKDIVRDEIRRHTGRLD